MRTVLAAALCAVCVLLSQSVNAQEVYSGASSEHSTTYSSVIDAPAVGVPVGEDAGALTKLVLQFDRRASDAISALKLGGRDVWRRALENLGDVATPLVRTIDRFIATEHAAGLSVAACSVPHLDRALNDAWTSMTNNAAAAVAAITAAETISQEDKETLIQSVWRETADRLLVASEHVINGALVGCECSRPNEWERHVKHFEWGLLHLELRGVASCGPVQNRDDIEIDAMLLSGGGFTGFIDFNQVATTAFSLNALKDALTPDQREMLALPDVMPMLRARRFDVRARIDALGHQLEIIVWSDSLRGLVHSISETLRDSGLPLALALDTVSLGIVESTLGRAFFSPAAGWVPVRLKILENNM